MTYFTQLVEHYLRAAVRFPVPFGDPIARGWQEATQAWVDSLPDDDKTFIKSVFAYEHFKTSDGIFSLPGKAGHNWKRLNALEKELAQYLNLIGD